jgi:hypothetical protein
MSNPTVSNSQCDTRRGAGSWVVRRGLLPVQISSNALTARWMTKSRKMFSLKNPATNSCAPYPLPTRMSVYGCD